MTVRMIEARRPGRPTIYRIDKRTEQQQIDDRARIAEILEGTRAIEASDAEVQQCIMAQAAYRSLELGWQKCLLRYAVSSSELFLLITKGEWEQAAAKLLQMSPSMPNRIECVGLAVHLEAHATNIMEDTERAAQAAA